MRDPAGDRLGTCDDDTRARPLPSHLLQGAACPPIRGKLLALPASAMRMGIGAVSVYLPAHRASRIDPARALREGE